MCLQPAQYLRIPASVINRPKFGRFVISMGELWCRLCAPLMHCELAPPWKFYLSSWNMHAHVKKQYARHNSSLGLCSLIYLAESFRECVCVCLFVFCFFVFCVCGEEFYHCIAQCSGCGFDPTISGLQIRRPCRSRGCRYTRKKALFSPVHRLVRRNQANT